MAQKCSVIKFQIGEIYVAWGLQLSAEHLILNQRRTFLPSKNWPTNQITPKHFQIDMYCMALVDIESVLITACLDVGGETVTGHIYGLDDWLSRGLSDYTRTHKKKRKQREWEKLSITEPKKNAGRRQQRRNWNTTEQKSPHTCTLRSLSAKLHFFARSYIIWQCTPKLIHRPREQKKSA